MATAALRLVTTVVFDVLGTLLSLDRPRAELKTLGAPECALDLWFAQSIRDACALSHAGGYAPLKEVLEAELPRTLASLGVEADAMGRGMVLGALGQLEPVEGAADALATLAERGDRVIALTNAAEATTRKLLLAAGLHERFFAFLSADEVSKTKPHPDVYALAAKQAAGDTWMVSAHAWDVMGAARAGWRTAWIAKTERRYLDQIYPAPTVVADDIVAAVRSIAEQSAVIPERAGG
jgi:2-haloacid dehalogenase